MLSTKSSMSADQTVLLAYQLIAKLHLKPYESLTKPFVCVSTHSSANAFPIWWSSEKSSWSSEEPWVKRKEDGWLDAVRKPIVRTSTSAYKTVNLVNTLGWSREMLSVNRRSHVIRHVLILRKLRRSKDVALSAKSWRSAQSTQLREWAELHQGHVQGSRSEVTCRGEVKCRGEVMCRGHASCQEWYAFTNGWSNNSADSLNQT